MKDIKIIDVRVHPGDSGFLIDDGETAVLYDSGFAFTGYELAENIKRELGDRELDYIFLSHSHYDHVLGSASVLRTYPDATVVAGEYAAKIFAKPSARATMRDLDEKVAATCGITDYEDLIDEIRVDITVNDGDVVETGNMRWRVIALPGHTKCSTGFYEEDNKLLLGSETLGNYDGESTIIPAYLVGYQMTLDSIEKAKKLDAESILLPHYGVITGDKAKWYFESIAPAATEIAEAFKALIEAGASDEELKEYYKDRYYHGIIKISYPEDAMELNTGILAQLIRRELCSN
jgi:glyoxylase-like metal-dependent hydrolase (beta-lactamase superfamily II)